MMLKKHNEIELVNQIDDKTCVAACLSMALGKPIETVLMEFSLLGLDAPFFDKDWFAYLVRHSVLPERITGGMPVGSLYMVTVISRNITGVYHLVLVSIDEEGDIKIYDPQRGNSGKKYYDYNDWELGKDFPWSGIVQLTDCSIRRGN